MLKPTHDQRWYKPDEASEGFRQLTSGLISAGWYYPKRQWYWICEGLLVLH
jgi:hypothetical protein